MALFLHLARLFGGGPHCFESFLELSGLCLGGESGIRLHPAGRDLGCKPSPSNPTREVRKDFTPLENENAPRGAFELLARVAFKSSLKT